jgi:NAD(P)H-hydrate epimerase
MVTPVLQHSQGPDSISYLTQAQAASVDEALMGELGFSIDQLMV